MQNNRGLSQQTPLILDFWDTSPLLTLNGDGRRAALRWTSWLTDLQEAHILLAVGLPVRARHNKLFGCLASGAVGSLRIQR